MVSTQTRNPGVVSLMPPCLTIETPLVKEARGNHLIKSSSLEELRGLSLVFSTLKPEYATLFFDTQVECNDKVLFFAFFIGRIIQPYLAIDICKVFYYSTFQRGSPIDK